MHLLEVEDVYKDYGTKRVLDNVDLKVKAGEFCTVIGPSGCGKSTLLRLILGQEAPTEGTVLVNGQPVGLPDRTRGIVYQKYTLFPHLSVLENVLLGRRLEQWWNPFYRKKEHVEEAMDYLNRVRLAEAAGKYPHELSGGMQQRVAIAQSLIMKPPILLMDEPFGALDPDTRTDLQLYLLELWEREGLTIFFVTHDMTEACFLGTRLLVLSQYYSDDRGESKEVRRGGRIVSDHPLPDVATSTEIINSKDFQALIEQVRQEGFNPAIRQHVRDFNLKHPDSFRTLLQTEDHQIGGGKIL